MALAAARDVGVGGRPGRGDEHRRAGQGAGRHGAARRWRIRPRDETTSPARRAALHRPRRPPSPPPRPGRGQGRQEGRTPHRPDRVFLPNVKDPIPIRPTSGEMFILQQLRDEAHRFAVSFHRGQRRRLTLRSVLSTIPGHRARPAAPALAPLRQRQAGPAGDGRRAGGGLGDEPERPPRRSSTTSPASRRRRRRPEARATAEELAIEDAFTNSDGEVLEMTRDAAPPRAARSRRSALTVTPLPRRGSRADWGKFDLCGVWVV